MQVGKNNVTLLRSIKQLLLKLLLMCWLLVIAFSKHQTGFQIKNSGINHYLHEFSLENTHHLTFRFTIQQISEEEAL